MAPAGGVTPYEVRQRRKDKVLTTLGKLDDRDTQAAAVTEIADLVRVSAPMMRGPGSGKPPRRTLRRAKATGSPAALTPCCWLTDCPQALDAEGLGVLVTCVCNIGDKQKVYSRKVRGRPALQWS